MPDTSPHRSSVEGPSEPVHYASFILRCWTGTDGQIRARLIDAQSGISQPVADLADLPEQVRCLMAQTEPGEPPQSTE